MMVVMVLLYGFDPESTSSGAVVADRPDQFDVDADGDVVDVMIVGATRGVVVSTSASEQTPATNDRGRVPVSNTA